MSKVLVNVPESKKYCYKKYTDIGQVVNEFMPILYEFRIIFKKKTEETMCIVHRTNEETLKIDVYRQCLTTLSGNKIACALWRPKLRLDVYRMEPRLCAFGAPNIL